MRGYKLIWNKKKTSEKILGIMGFICSISIIVLASIQLLGLWEGAINVFEPLLGILMGINAIQYWKSNRVAAILSLIAAIIILIVSIMVFSRM